MATNDTEVSLSTKPVCGFETSTGEELKLIKQGAEARLFTGVYLGKPAVLKERFSKRYRHPDLDQLLSRKRHKAEARNLLKCREAGIDVPCLYFVHLTKFMLVMERIDGETVRDRISAVQTSHPNSFLDILGPLAEQIGAMIALLHCSKLIHGDLTTSNMLIRRGVEDGVVLIDFGLSYGSQTAEDRSTDLYVLERALLSTHPNTETLFEWLLNQYLEHSGKDGKKTIAKLNEVRLRGRKREMVG